MACSGSRACCGCWAPAGRRGRNNETRTPGHTNQTANQPPLNFMTLLQLNDPIARRDRRVKPTASDNSGTGPKHVPAYEGRSRKLNKRDRFGLWRPPPPPATAVLILLLRPLQGQREPAAGGSTKS